MSKKTLTLLWVVTGLAALSLLAATISLAAKASPADVAGSDAVVSNTGEAVYLRASPGATRRILSILAPGEPVTILSEETRNQRIWFFIETETLTGWVPAASIRLAGASQGD
jgi:hypothetical protein